jgi:hypothetical protein
MSAIGLTLKVVTHYGEFAGYNVKNFNKLIGKDIIVAHQLLKNDIEQHEYWLVTKSLAQNRLPSGFAQWMTWNDSVKQTESGEIPFHYTHLSELKNRLPPEPSPQLELLKKTKMISLSREYETDIITLFHATGDYHFRPRWQEGVKKVEEVGHFLPRVGMKCRSVLENGQSVIYYASSYSYQPERIEFSETEEKKKDSTYYLLEKTGPKRTKLTLSYYVPKNRLGEILFKLTQRREVEDRLQKSMLNLDSLAKEIKLPGEVPDSV